VRVGQPLHLADLVRNYRPVGLLRSADGHNYVNCSLLHSKIVIAGRRFSCVAPNMNSLHIHFRTASSSDSVSDINSKLTFSVLLMMSIHNKPSASESLFYE